MIPTNGIAQCNFTTPQGINNRSLFELVLVVVINIVVSALQFSLLQVDGSLIKSS